MLTDTTLIEKREELKRRLAAHEFKTLVDIFLARIDLLIRKITRRTKPFPIWTIGVILIVLVNSIGFVVNSIAGDWGNTIEYFRLLGIEFETGVLWKVWDNILAVTALLVINGYIGRIFSFWNSRILDATETMASLKIFEDWLYKICNRRLHFIVAIIGGLFASIYSADILSAVNLQFAFIGIGFALMQLTNYIINFSSFYLFFMFVLLAARLRYYDMKLFAADPSSSELIARLSAALNLIVYIVAGFAAISVPVFTLVGYTAADLLVLMLLWAPIIFMFVLNQSSMSSIILRVKWKTLNEIQARVQNLQARENYDEKETMDSISRLLDYHNQVKATRNSAIDLTAVLSFINSLLLPLLAFVLGNLDFVLNLFIKQP